MARIHPTANIGNHVELAEDVEIGPMCTIGDFVKIGSGSVLQKLSSIGSNVTLDENVNVGPMCTIGDFVKVGSGSVLQKLSSIGSNVTLGEKVRVGVQAELEDHVQIGSGTVLQSQCFIGAYTSMGENNNVYPFASIGTDPEDYAYDADQEPSFTRIGSHNKFREGVTVNRGTHPGTTTVIGDGCFLMAQAHVAHNCELGNGVIMVPFSGIAGYCQIGDRCLISGLSGIHQFCRMGRFAVLSGGSTISVDLPPFMIGDGRNGGVRGFNLVGLRRANFPPETIKAIKKVYDIFFRQNLNVKNAIARVEQEVPQIPEVVEFLDFVKSSKRGILSGDRHGRRS